MLVLGLTGSIGMGKSTVAAVFRAMGVPVDDADASVHALYRGKAVPLIEAAFPGVSRAGAIDRALLGQQVLHDPEQLAKLESIIHPLVREMRDAFLQQAEKNGARVAVVDIPLLFETGGDKYVDMVVVVSAPLAVQKARVLTREGMSEARFHAILAKQMPDAEKRRRAHVVIDTAGDLDFTRRQVRDLLRALSALD
ncbi:dephospho-CoA kinase [Methylovirgula sp. 4M-Z18]|uniref:dephospho-CoA kinase n=1 Tax=Methylovirgula sp. 4M-Z18 TaxID=2293567 RepID=UPI000E2F283D|nr:dephospho-CoA kinase [Methylovirgula sp. 4M-Z18]RFB78049.1 dephospho-CoA kinase [Methylovirgula sp. 4M-Z18]